jgi:hypothetical protein
LTVPDFQYTDDSTKRISICAETEPVLMEGPAKRLWQTNVDMQTTSKKSQGDTPSQAS